MNAFIVKVVLVNRKFFKCDGSSLLETFVRMQSNMLMYISIFETLNRPIQGKWSTYMFHFDVE